MNTRMPLVALAAVAWAAGWAQLASAQGQQKVDAEAYQALAAPPGVSALALPTPSLIVSGSKDTKEAKARLGIDYYDLLVDLQFVAPLQGAEEVNPVSLDGLADGTTAEFGLGYIHWPVRPDPIKIQELCRAIGREECDDSSFTDPAQRRAYLDAFNFSRTPVLVGLRVRAGRNEFKWRDKTTLAESVSHHNDWSVSGTVGFYNPRMGFLGGQFDRQDSYRGGSKTNVCQPLAGTNATTCRDLVLGAPTKTSRSIARIELRRFSRGGKFAINPSWSRDLDEDVSSLQLPIFFLQDGKGGLNGGVTAGWRSDTKAFTLSLFVGASLDLASMAHSPN